MTDHIRMLCDIGEMNRLFAESISIESFLDMIVVMVADHMQAQVCSIYLHDEQNDELILKATVGLNKNAVNTLKLKPNEGLVGTAFSEKKSIIEKSAQDNPNFKPIPGISEEAYQAFLAVPVVLGAETIGVLTLQRILTEPFSETDITALQATSSQLASMIGNARAILMAGQYGAAWEKKAVLREKKFYHGKVASRGYAHAPASALIEKPAINDLITLHECSKNFSDLLQAFAKTEQELENLQKRVETNLNDAASLIFTSHLLMLKDKSFIDAIKNAVDQGKPPHHALVEIFNKYVDIFSSSPSQLIREKVQDLEDLVRRVLENLLDLDHEETLIRGHVVITRDLFPSDLLRLSAEDISGIVLIGGGVTSHLSILARSLEIPMLIVDDTVLFKIAPETPVLMDAEQGILYIEPEQDIVKNFEIRNRNRQRLMENRDIVARPAFTSDGRQIKIMINVNLLTDLNRIDSEMIDGIGLYRTEFPFLIRNSFPSEEEQYVIYRKLFTSIPDRPITFRTLDIGGDKVLSYYDAIHEQNPFLGMRSIRFSLTHEELFKTQLRAIMRAGFGYQLRIMFPMISSMEEFNRSLELVIEAGNELKEKNIDYNCDPQLGVMIELPSAVFIIEELAAAVDFVSVGTNDLIQYILGVDRTNEKVAHLYIPHHPAVLRALYKIASTARSFGKSVSICGDMGSSPAYLPFLLGAGFDALSIDPGSLPSVKEGIRALNMEEAKKMTKDMLEDFTIQDIERKLQPLPYPSDRDLQQ